MHISEIGLCSGHSASGVWVNERGETTVPGLYAAGDMACVPHNYLLGALTYGITRIFGTGAVGPVVVSAVILIGSALLFVRRAQRGPAVTAPEAG